MVNAGHMTIVQKDRRERRLAIAHTTYVKGSCAVRAGRLVERIWSIGKGGDGVRGISHWEWREGGRAYREQRYHQWQEGERKADRFTCGMDKWWS